MILANVPTDWVAWYGAIVATIAVFPTVFNLWRDTPRLRVVARADMLVAGEGHTVYTIIEVANIGRRPVSLRQMPCFETDDIGKKGYIVKGPWGPHDRLEEGQSANMLCEQDGLPFDQIRRVVVVDETGRKWPGKVVRAIT